jgi:hypothetical protein
LLSLALSLTIQLMGIVWRVQINTGARVRLVADGQGKQIWRPQSMSRDEFFRLLPKDVTIDDEFLQLIFLIWE